MSAKQDIVYTRTASALEQKLNVRKSFQEVLGLVDETRNRIDSVESTLKSEIRDQYTTIMRDTEQVMVTALQSYVTKDEHEEFQENTEAEFIVQSDQISQSVSSTTELVSKTVGELNAALDEYVQTEDYNKYRESVQTSLDVLAGEIVMQFTRATEHIESVDGEMKSEFNTLYNYIKIVDGEMTFGSGDNQVTLSIDHERIAIKRNGQVCGYWDQDFFYTGSIVVRLDERVQIGNFAFVPRKNGNTSFLKVGG